MVKAVEATAQTVGKGKEGTAGFAGCILGIVEGVLEGLLVVVGYGGSQGECQSAGEDGQKRDGGSPTDGTAKRPATRGKLGRGPVIHSTGEACFEVGRRVLFHVALQAKLFGFRRFCPQESCPQAIVVLSFHRLNLLNLSRMAWRPRLRSLRTLTADCPVRSAISS